MQTLHLPQQNLHLPPLPGMCVRPRCLARASAFPGNPFACTAPAPPRAAEPAMVPAVHYQSSCGGIPATEEA